MCEPVLIQAEPLCFALRVPRQAHTNSQNIQNKKQTKCKQTKSILT